MRTLAATQRLAIFDLDRTLIPGSSLVPLARQLSRRGLVDRARLVGAVARNTAFARRGADASTAERVTADALAAVTGLEAGVLAEAVLDAACDVARTFRPAIHRLARQHAAMGETCVIVSAAPHELVQHVARLGDFDLGIGTRVEVRDGVLTGRLDGPFCHGAGKLARLRDDLAWADLRWATVYTDAGSDLPLLEACGFPVAVRPDRALRAVARRSGWPVVAH